MANQWTRSAMSSGVGRSPPAYLFTLEAETFKIFARSSSPKTFRIAVHSFSGAGDSSIAVRTASRAAAASVVDLSEGGSLSSVHSRTTVAYPEVL